MYTNKETFYTGLQLFHVSLAVAMTPRAMKGDNFYRIINLF